MPQEPVSKFNVFKAGNGWLSYEDREVLRDVRAALTSRRPTEAAKAVYWWLRREGWRYTPLAWFDKRADRRFDLHNRVDTATRAELPALSIRSPNRVHGVYYQASPVRETRRVLAHLDIRYQDYSFVDFGSGKGRVLLLASEFPFRRVIGVEFAEELHAIAQRNIATYPHKVCRDVSAICMDAADYRFEDGNIVAYFYNPFDRHILSRVIDNLVAAKCSSGKDVRIIYHFCADRDLFAASGMFKLIRDSRKYLVYRVASSASSNLDFQTARPIADLAPRCEDHLRGGAAHPS